MRAMKRVGLAACALLFLAGVALSDVNQEGEPIRFSIQLSGEFSDNRDGSVEKDDNFDLMVSPRVDGILQWGDRGMLDLYYEPIYRYRSNPSDIQNDAQLFHDLGIIYKHHLTRPLEVRAMEHLNITDDPSVQQGGTTLRRDSSFVLNRAQVGVNYAFSRKSNIDAEINGAVKRYEELERRRESDEDRVGAVLTVWRQTSRKTGWLAAVRAGQQGYHRNDNVERDYSSLQGEVGVRKVWSSNMQADARAGYTQLDYDNEEIDTQASPFALVSTRFSPQPTTRFTGSFSYTLRDSDLYPFASQSYVGLGFEAGWDCSKRVTLQLAGTYRIGDYDQDTIDSDAISYQTDRNYGLDGQETTVVVAAAMTYKLGNDLDIRLAQQYSDIDSDVSISYDRNSTRFGLSKKF